MKKFFLSIFMIAVCLVAFPQNDEDRWVDSVYNSMSMERRVGQLLNVRVNYPNKDCLPEIQTLIKDYGIGGVTFFRTNSEYLLEQTNLYQSISDLPLMVAIDGEWGLGMRLNDGISYPYQMTLGAIQNQELITEMGIQIAEQCRRLGINVDFAPDVDVNSEPTNPVIGMRSFGENPKQVAERGARYALALQENGVMPTMKHFPGHGDTKTDSHETLPKINKSFEEIKKTELYPFKYLIDNGVVGVMVGHLYMPAIEPVANTSSSLSRTVVTELLKENMHFSGLVFSDALEMKGAYKSLSPDEVGLQALLAGTDVLLMPVNPQKTIEFIVMSSNKKDVAKRIEESCKKILRVKYRMGLKDAELQPIKSVSNDINLAKYYNFRQRLYNEAVTMLENKNETLPLNRDSKIAIVTVGNDDIMYKTLKDDGLNVSEFKIDPEINSKETDKIVKKLKYFDYVIVNVRNTSIYAASDFGIKKETVAFVEKISKNNRIIFNLFACPYAYSKFKFKHDPVAVLVGYEDKKEAVKAVADILVGVSSPSGKLPVTVNKKYKVGFGMSYKDVLSPETLKMSLIDNKFTRKIDSVALNGIEIGAYPGCQILALKDGKIIYEKNFGSFTYESKIPVHSDDVYDIASLTKVFATTFAIMKLYDEHKISMESTLGDYLPYLKNTDKGDLKIIEIMTHQAGLTPWLPLYQFTLKDGNPDMNLYRTNIDENHTVRVAKNLYLENDYDYQMLDSVSVSHLGEKKYKYSDLGFYYLPKIVELVTNKPFETYLQENFYKPLNLNHIFYKPLNHIDIDKIAPTENDVTFRKQQLQGDVHDQAAALFGGVSGHAGLFANARDLAVLMQLLLNQGYANGKQFLSDYTIEKFTSAPFVENMNRRGIGFDKPEVDPEVKFYTPAKQSSMASFGHTGFTGTFAWADPENQLIMIFLSNRVYPDASNNKLAQNDIRTKIHELFYEAVK